MKKFSLLLIMVIAFHGAVNAYYSYVDQSPEANTERFDRRMEQLDRDMDRTNQNLYQGDLLRTLRNR